MGYGFVGNDVFADGEAHAGAEAKRWGEWTWNDAVWAHDLRCYIGESSGHFFRSQDSCFTGFSVCILNKI